MVMVVEVLLIDCQWSIICDEITLFRGKFITIPLAYAGRHSMNLTLNFIMILCMSCSWLVYVRHPLDAVCSEG